MDKRAFLDRIKNAEKSRLNNKLPDFDDSETVSYAAIGEGGARTVFERNFVKNREIMLDIWQGILYYK